MDDQVARPGVVIKDDTLNRKRWAAMAAKIFTDYMPEEAIVTCALRGFDEFLRIATPVYDGHAFQYDDFKDIYGIICERAAALQEDRARRLHLIDTDGRLN